jgi:GAF domain-containing protein
MARYEADGTATVIGAAGDHPFPPGSAWKLDGPSVVADVFRTRRPSRIEHYAELPGTIAEIAHGAGFRSAIGAPIIVDGLTWGAIIAFSSLPERIPELAVSRLTQFTELVAAAVSNATARAELVASRARIVTAADDAAAARAQPARRHAAAAARAAARPPARAGDDRRRPGSRAGGSRSRRARSQLGARRGAPGVPRLAPRPAHARRTPAGSRAGRRLPSPPTTGHRSTRPHA